MSKHSLRHIWFDFSDTLALIGGETHEHLRYETYANLIGKPVSKALKKDYDELFKKYRSNTAVFHALGKPVGFWSEQIGQLDPTNIYTLAEANLAETLQAIKKCVPISIFSNIHLTKVLPSLGLSTEWFTHVLSSGMFSRPKPDLEGFYKMVELSGLPADQILYVGDNVPKDIRPAHKVGMQTALMWRQSDEADYCFKHFKDILTIL